MIHIIFGVIVAVLAGLDLWCKSYVEEHISKGKEKMIFKDRIAIRKVYNEGMAFNLGENHPKVIRILSVIVCGILSFFSILEWKNGSCPWKKFGVSLMLAGAVSNTYDRLVKKRVTDYFGFRTKWEKFNRITFNLGDMFLFLGSVILFIAEIFWNKK